MTPKDFAQWRTRLQYTPAQAARVLGISQRTVYSYETGRNGTRPMPIPRAIALACHMLEIAESAPSPRYDVDPPHADELPAAAPARRERRRA